MLRARTSRQAPTLPPRSGPQAVDPPRCCGALVAFGPFLPDWTDVAGLIVLLLTLLLAVRFYRRMALRIHHSERQLKEVLESAPFAIGVTRRDTGEFLFANRRAIAQLALAPAEYHHQRVPYANADQVRSELLQHLARHGMVLDREVELIAYNGRRFSALGSVVPVEFAGHPALIGTFQDISSIKESERRLRESEMRLQALFQAAPDGIVIISSAGTIHSASESCADLMGIDTERLAAAVGCSILDFVPESDRANAAEMLRRVVADQPRDPLAYRIPRRDGTFVWVEPRAVSLRDPATGQPSILLFLRNITRRREAHEQLAAHAARLQEALARIAHLQNAILRVCAWTKQVEVDGEWIPIDHYLAKHLGIKVSHGISEQGLAMLEQGTLPPAPRPPPPNTAEPESPPSPPS